MLSRIFRAFVTYAEVVGTRCSRLRLFASFLLCCLPLLLLVVACAACLCELVLKLVVVRSIRVGILLLFGAAFYLLLLLLSVIVFRAPCFGFLFPCLQLVFLLLVCFEGAPLYVSGLHEPIRALLLATSAAEAPKCSKRTS